ncbi:MAG: DUF2628 domain-containing protein [bacterium]
MFCRNCGKEIIDYSEICVYCGVKPLRERNFCQACSAPTNANQDLCIACGTQLKSLHAISQNFSVLPKYYQDEFMKIYLSNESYKGNWNVMGLLFGPIWAIFKGIWLASLLDIIGAWMTCGIVGIVYWFIFGARGTYLYYCAYVKKQQLPW